MKAWDSNTRATSFGTRSAKVGWRTQRERDANPHKISLGADENDKRSSLHLSRARPALALALIVEDPLLPRFADKQVKPHLHLLASTVQVQTSAFAAYDKLV
jgi:hypothetical protein